MTAAVGLLAYLQGRTALPLFLPHPIESRAHRLFLEILIGNVVMSVSGLFLAEMGWFTLPRLVALGILLSLAGQVPRLRRRVRAARRPYGASDAAAVALLAAAALWAAPAFDTTLFGSDSSTYLASGISIARHGSIAMHDPTIERFTPQHRAQLFPSYRRDHAPPFLRVPGGLLLPSLEEDTVLPAFHHLFSVWIAIFFGLGGDPALSAAATYFAALSLWAIAVFALQLGGRGGAGLAVAVSALLVPQSWYSRFPMPEVPSQYFLWAGLCVASWSLRAPGGRLGVLAGLALGTAGLMRLDNLVHLVAGLALWKTFSPAGSWPASRGFALGFAAISAYALVHQFCFPTHYAAEAIAHLARAWTLIAGHGLLAVLAGALAVTAAVVLQLAGRPGSATGVLERLAALLCLAAYVAAAFLATRPDLGAQLQWVRASFPLPLLLAMLPGLVLWAAAAPDRAQGFALVLGVLVTANLLYDPRVTPTPLWAVRRAVPIALPLVAVAAAIAVLALSRRVPRVATIAALGAVLIPLVPPFASAYRPPAYRGTIAHVRAIGALLPPGAVVVGDPSLFVPSQLHVALWATGEFPPFVFSRRMVPSLRRLRHALSDRRVFWLGSGNAPLSDTRGLRFVPVATYEFGIATPRLEAYDPRTDFAVRAITVAIYELR